jgi:signal transduction histidine kinase
VPRSVLRNSLVVALCGGFLVLSAIDPGALVIHRAPVLNAIFDTSVAIIGTMVAFLCIGRFRKSRTLDDLMIVGAVLLLSWVHAFFDAFPDLASPHLISSALSGRVEYWGTNVTRVLAACYLIVGTVPASKRKRTEGRLHHALPFFAFPAVIGVTTMTLLVWLVPANSEGLLNGLQWHQAISPLLQIVGALMLFIACVRLSAESATSSDTFKGWLATGCIFAGFDVFSSALFSSHGADWIRPSDVFREAAVATWAWGAVAEIRYYWATVANVAKIEARRSVALDLHDGLSQELALLSTYVCAPPEVRLTSEWYRHLRATAERALAEARRTITTLAGDTPRPIETDLRQTADFASGIGVDVNVAVDASSVSLFTDSSQREAIVRIVREAVTNAVRHGQAKRIDISFSGVEGSPILRVSDDGLGFDPTVVNQSGHYGLVSMRERAEAIGASLAVQSKPGEGTTVQVLWS